MKKIGKALGTMAALAVLAYVMAEMAGFLTEKIDPQPKHRGAADTPAGTVTTVRKLVEPSVEMATGNIRARNETVVSARLTAVIESVAVRGGDTVISGDLLVTLDSREHAARLAQHEDALRAARARQTEARTAFERARTLFAKRTVPEATLDTAEANLRAADAQVSGAENAVREARTALSHTRIHAPLAGRVVDRYADPGDTATPGIPLIRLYDPGALRLEAQVRESVAVRLQRGDAVRAQFDALGRSFNATVDEVVPTADPTSRTFLVKALLPQAKGLFPGMFGRLVVEVGEVERTVVPSGAVFRVGQLEYVLVPRDAAEAARRFVRTGRASGADVEILSGLRPGERILIPDS